MSHETRTFLLRRVAMLGALACFAAPVPAQTPAPPALADTAAASPAIDLATPAALSWLQGCWRGVVNQREFREYWLPYAGGMMLGAGHTVMQDKTQDYQYLRLETRADGVHYVSLSDGRKEADFRLTSATTDDNGTQFTFTNVADAFPQRIVYRRGGEGWLYASAEGKLNGEDRKVIYPMRRIGCESGEPLRK